MDWSQYVFQLNEELKYPLLKLQNYEISVWSIFVFVLIIVFSKVLATRLSKIITKTYFHSSSLDIGRQDSLVKIVHYTIYSIGIMIALQTIGINISTLLAGGAVLAVGIGFGIQNIVTNFVAGILILFERPIKKGDFIEVGKDVFGIVTDIAIRHTTVKTLDNVAILIPNSKFVTENITNWTYQESQIKIRMAFNTPLTVKVKDVEKILSEIAKNNSGVLADPEPSVLLDVGANLTFHLIIWIKDPAMYNVVRSSLNFEIIEAFQKNNIY
ncbi:MAG: mechanosensitive ion channel, partial [Candidatus Sericytochromatia bacterium]|nr:mechanosensitive ion channel [Candidatus Sericytochromatia bacterium]